MPNRRTIAGFIVMGLLACQAIAAGPQYHHEGKQHGKNPAGEEIQTIQAEEVVRWLRQHPDQVEKIVRALHKQRLDKAPTGKWGHSGRPHAKADKLGRQHPTAAGRTGWNMPHRGMWFGGDRSGMMHPDTGAFRGRCCDWGMPPGRRGWGTGRMAGQGRPREFGWRGGRDGARQRGRQAVAKRRRAGDCAAARTPKPDKAVAKRGKPGKAVANVEALARRIERLERGLAEISSRLDPRQGKLAERAEQVERVREQLAQRAERLERREQELNEWSRKLQAQQRELERKNRGSRQRGEDAPARRSRRKDQPKKVE